MNKPVAWIIDAKMTDCDDNFIWNTGDYPDWQVEDWIPLYTHTVKELTDAEILEYADAFGMDMGNSYEIGHGQFILAVRAILRKAQRNETSY